MSIPVVVPQSVLSALAAMRLTQVYPSDEAPPPSGDDAILLEDGTSYLLLEDGGKILLET